MQNCKLLQEIQCIKQELKVLEHCLHLKCLLTSHPQNMITIACYIVYIVCTGVKFLIRHEISAFRHVSMRNGAVWLDIACLYQNLYWDIPIYIRTPLLLRNRKIPRTGLKILTKCWKFHGRGVNSVGNSIRGM